MPWWSEVKPVTSHSDETDLVEAARQLRVGGCFLEGWIAPHGFYSQIDLSFPVAAWVRTGGSGPLSISRSYLLIDVPLLAAGAVSSFLTANGPLSICCYFWRALGGFAE